MTTPILSAQQKECLMVLIFLYLQNGKYTEGKILLEGMKHLYPDDDNIVRSLSLAYLEDGDYEHALLIADNAQQKDPNSHHNRFYNLIKSKAFWRLGKKQEAKQCLNLFIENISQ